MKRFLTLLFLLVVSLTAIGQGNYMGYSQTQIHGILQYYNPVITITSEQTYTTIENNSSVVFYIYDENWICNEIVVQPKTRAHARYLQGFYNKNDKSIIINKNQSWMVYFYDKPVIIRMRKWQNKTYFYHNYANFN